MPTNTEPSATPRLRIAEINITNYKAIESLRIAFPRPSTPDELDAFVLGSQNGIGKTSVLECCALALLSTVFHDMIQTVAAADGPDSVDHLIRAGETSCAVGSSLQQGEELASEILRLKRGWPMMRGPSAWSKEFFDSSVPEMIRRDPTGLLPALLGMTNEPLLMPPLLLFTSYRKVSEGRAQLGDLMDLGRRFGTRSRPQQGIGAFKIALVQTLMAKSGMFEGSATGTSSEEALELLNGLIRDFARGRVDKLKLASEGELELRVSPISGGPSFSFDGLSSGQKEIISTLFLIWHSTRNRPSVVLIDEPELHLNAEWQRLFVHKLRELSPQNQYIMATHSEEIFASVPAEKRLMLRLTPTAAQG